MKKLIFLITFFCLFNHAFAQGSEAYPTPPDLNTTLYFKYDEAGNQKYRGTDINANRIANEENKTPLVVTSATTEVNQDDLFLSKVNIYPVPVKTILTVTWAEEVDGLIQDVSLYEHSTVHWAFQKENKPELNRKVEIDMTGYYMGIYVVRFQLTDGRVISKNIIKQ